LKLKKHSHVRSSRGRWTNASLTALSSGGTINVTQVTSMRCRMRCRMRSRVERLTSVMSGRSVWIGGGLLLCGLAVCTYTRYLMDGCPSFVFSAVSLQVENCTFCEIMQPRAVTVWRISSGIVLLIEQATRQRRPSQRLLSMPTHSKSPWTTRTCSVSNRG
jgi:hypothetical protein